MGTLTKEECKKAYQSRMGTRCYGSCKKYTSKTCLECQKGWEIIDQLIDEHFEIIKEQSKLKQENKLFEDYLEDIKEALNRDEYEDNVDILNNILNLFNNLRYRLGEIENNGD